jgi:CRISPR-associated protein Csm1
MDGSEGVWLSLGHAEPAAEPWPILRQVPTSSAGDVLDFDEIAEFSPGIRKFLGYARIDADHVGEKFDGLDGDPKRTWALSRLLHFFFGSHAGDVLRERFPHIYAVYGGGDDLFVIGPWAEALEYVLELRCSLRSLAGEGLTLSAGVHLAKPIDHVLSAADEASVDLEKAKTDRAWGRSTGRDQVRALEVVSDWDTFRKLLEEGKRASRWLEDRQMPTSFLKQVLLLHDQWRRPHRPADRVRYRPLLRYQAERNLRSEVRSWALSYFREDSLWPWANFIARYALLSSRRARESEGSDG